HAAPGPGRRPSRSWIPRASPDTMVPATANAPGKPASGAAGGVRAPRAPGRDPAHAGALAAMAVRRCPADKKGPAPAWRAFTRAPDGAPGPSPGGGRLLLAQGLDRIELAGLARRVVAEEQAGRDREPGRQRDHPAVELHRQVAVELPHQQRAADADQDP